MRAFGEVWYNAGSVAFVQLLQSCKQPRLGFVVGSRCKSHHLSHAATPDLHMQPECREDGNTVGYRSQMISV